MSTIEQLRREVEELRDTPSFFDFPSRYQERKERELKELEVSEKTTKTCPDCGCHRTHRNEKFAWCLACPWIEKTKPPSS